MSDMEQRLAAAGAAWRAEMPAPQAVRAARPRRWLPAVAAAAVVALAVAATALAGLGGTARQVPVETGSSEGGWTSMSPSPLSARLRPTVVGWRDAVVVLGGRIERPCPPNASCARDLRDTQRDGALYDLPTDSWERLPDAPLPLDVGSSAVLDDVLYLWLNNDRPAFLSLDLEARRWSTLPVPPVVGSYLRLTATDDRIVAAYGEVARADAVDQQWDPGAQQWSPLPTAPFVPAFDRSMVWTGDALILIAPTSPEVGPPFMRAAALRDGAWEELPAQETVIFGATDWSWTGSRAVAATTAKADGGQTNGFGRPFPSGGYLDPRTGTWTELPETPPSHQPTYGRPVAAGGRYVANGEGLVLDTGQERWIPLPSQPDQADQDAAAAWAAGRLVVWGGAAGVLPAPQPGEARLLDSGAVWTPPAD